MAPNRPKQKTFNQWMALLRAFKREHKHLKTSAILNPSLHRWVGKIRASLKVYHKQKVKTQHEFNLTQAQVKQLERIGFSSTQGRLSTERKKLIREAKEKSYRRNAEIVYDLAIEENPSNRPTFFPDCIEVALQGKAKERNCPWVSADVKYFCYPVKHYGGTKYSLHIASFFKKYNTYPKNEVSHRCHNARCINADHLVDESHLKNTQRLCCRFNLGWEGQEDYICPHGKLDPRHACIPIPKQCQVIPGQTGNTGDGRAERRARRARRASTST